MFQLDKFSSLSTNLFPASKHATISEYLETDFGRSGLVEILRLFYQKQKQRRKKSLVNNEPKNLINCTFYGVLLAWCLVGAF